MPSIADNLRYIQERIACAAEVSGRRPEDIVLVAVTKTIELSRIKEAIDAGVTELGENYVQEAVPKIESLGRPVRWHLIGHLQTNKARFAAQYFDTVQTVDDRKVAEALSRRVQGLGRSIDILVEVNISREAQKFGVEAERAVDFIGEIAGLPGLRVKGLMGMAPFSKNSEESRIYFLQLKEIFDSLPKETQMYLSMGMTDDFEAAIEEGSNMVRIGTGIFGPRS